MRRTPKAVLVMAAMVAAMLSVGGLSAAGLADVGLPPVTTSGETTTTETTAEEGPELPPGVDQEQLKKSRLQVVHYRTQACYWQRYTFMRCAKVKHMERHTTDVDQLQRLVAWWEKEGQKAKKYALSFKYADRYLPPLQARIVGQRLAAELYHWVGQQWQCLDELWGHRESSWWAHNHNREGSGAYGIPQALPGRKMGFGWVSSVLVQIKWGLRYIKTGNFGSAPFHSPCEAIAFHNIHNSY